MSVEIPQGELADYQNRTVVTVSALKWSNADHTVLTANVRFQELTSLGPIPFSTTADSDTIHGQEIWTKANDGEYGEIEDFVPPTIEEIRTSMPPLTPRQLRLALLSIDVTEAEVDASLAGDPAGMIDWKYATSYLRTYPLLESLGAGFGLTPTQIDDLWTYALTL